MEKFYVRNNRFVYRFNNLLSMQKNEIGVSVQPSDTRKGKSTETSFFSNAMIRKVFQALICSLIYHVFEYLGNYTSRNPFCHNVFDIYC